jgi:hypothetical protein
MTELLCTAPNDYEPDVDTFALTQAQAALRKMVLNSVKSPHTRRNYAKALDDLFLYSAGGAFDRYCELRDSTKAFHICKGCSRKWMNLDGDKDHPPPPGSTVVSGIFSFVTERWPEPRRQSLCHASCAERHVDVRRTLNCGYVAP